MPLTLTRSIRRESLARNNCLVLDLHDGTRVRVWVVECPGNPARVRLKIDAPPAVRVRRGEHIGAAAELPPAPLETPP